MLSLTSLSRGMSSVTILRPVSWLSILGEGLQQCMSWHSMHVDMTVNMPLFLCFQGLVVMRCRHPSYSSAGGLVCCISVHMCMRVLQLRQTHANSGLPTGVTVNVCPIKLCMLSHCGPQTHVRKLGSASFFS